MKTSLHLYTEHSNEPVFWQMLDYTFNLEEGDIFEYNQKHYDELDSKVKKSFDISGVKFGKYIVIAAQIEDKNEFHGKYKSLFLKPIMKNYS
ncbi:hypothetical protein [Flavobacterium columnare]|uniref:Uncharacterized protein n=1 Tax=Flavobacterium columnare TaxID=996 RepID=A0AAI8CJC1_9FLAO|nr:hypothetical protein [Flavobacterium columnare]AMO21003.1 hypothetical protein UN65_12250 [Flavobacterium columnare]AUX19005.1 hypothetical protein AQ623_12485 [Flavobacterium columnare]MEB3802033.1 hypothetical protein [Flavobacterium columnare]QOG58083.1 hypothetical protein HUE29_12305 [Flavobacterium columnare]QOG60805.1 hypothetical protein HUE30_12305 [Flavobacterium columnare]